MNHQESNRRINNAHAAEIGITLLHQGFLKIYLPMLKF
jgi:hypothetical protein